jgi:mRNA-degrading endonuclease RelE of RelBE toxin-antitoxin system
VPVARVTVRETPIFSRRADALLSPNERHALIAFLAENPLSGDVIKDTGGVRKVRFAAKGRGKSGGVRVIYYFLDLDTPLTAIFIYGKGEQVDLTAKQKRAVTDMAAAIKAASRISKRNA